MDDLEGLPKAISHKKLNSFLKSAQDSADPLETTRSIEEATPTSLDKFKDSASNLVEVAKDLLELLEKENVAISDALNKQQSMALGAFQVHLKMVLQAHSHIDNTK